MRARTVLMCLGIVVLALLANHYTSAHQVSDSGYISNTR